jgi:hypothetical protein
MATDTTDMVPNKLNIRKRQPNSRMSFFFIVDGPSFNDMVFMLYTNTDKNIFVCDVTVCNEHLIYTFLLSIHVIFIVLIKYN